MTDTSKVKKVIEPWFRDNYLSQHYPGSIIAQEKIPLIWGGEFEYDAVVRHDGEIVAVYLLSCSEYKTKQGKGGAGKFNKIKSDVLMMLGTSCQAKVMAFLGKTMFEQFNKQQEGGRLPSEIKCQLITPPAEIQEIISGIRNEASSEVTPISEIG